MEDDMSDFIVGYGAGYESGYDEAANLRLELYPCIITGGYNTISWSRDNRNTSLNNTSIGTVDAWIDYGGRTETVIGSPLTITEEMNGKHLYIKTYATGYKDGINDIQLEYMKPDNSLVSVTNGKPNHGYKLVCEMSNESKLHPQNYASKDGHKYYGATFTTDANGIVAGQSLFSFAAMGTTFPETFTIGLVDGSGSNVMGNFAISVEKNDVIVYTTNVGLNIVDIKSSIGSIKKGDIISFIINADVILASYATISNLGASDPSTVVFTRDNAFPINFEEVVKDGNVFFKVPTFYRKINSVDARNQITSFTVCTEKASDEYYPYPCFVKEDGTTIMDYVLIGKYANRSSDSINSVSSGGNYVIKWIGDIRSRLSNLSLGYQLFDWQMFILYRDLFWIANGFLARFGSESEATYGQWFDTTILNQLYIDGVFGNYNTNNSKKTYCFSYKPSEYSLITFETKDLYYNSSYSFLNTGYSSVPIFKMGYDPSHPFLNFPVLESSDPWNAGGTIEINTYYRMYRVTLPRYQNVYPVTLKRDSYSGVVGTLWEYESWQAYTLLCYRPISE